MGPGEDERDKKGLELFEEYLLSFAPSARCDMSLLGSGLSGLLDPEFWLLPEEL
jgi:hypothetical protein